MLQPPKAQPFAPANDIVTQHVKGKVWSITAGGRNTVVQVGDEGIMVVDPGSTEHAAAILAEIRKIAGNKPVRQIVYTSADLSRIGATPVINTPLNPGGQVANIIAHESVGLALGRARAASEMIPTDTFFRGERTIYFNDEPGPHHPYAGREQQRRRHGVLPRVGSPGHRPPPAGRELPAHQPRRTPAARSRRRWMS